MSQLPPPLACASRAEAAARLDAAQLTGEPCEPVAGLLADGGLDAAYEVQSWLTAAREARGAERRGAKVGLTSIAVQQQLGVDQPDFGTLFDDMEFLDGTELPPTRLIQPKVEAEIAFVIDRDLDAARPGLADVLRAVRYALPALEIIDSRIRDWKIGLLDTVADNASSALYVLGATPKKIDALDLPGCAMALELNGREVASGSGAACMGNPLNAVAWLARTLAALGRPLRAGDVVLSGALGPTVPIAAGDAFSARIQGLGQVRATLGALSPAAGRRPPGT